MVDIWKDKEALRKLEALRDAKRAKGKRLTFDCLKLKCQGDRAICSNGAVLSRARDRGMSLIEVLRGRTSGTCLSCIYFVTENNKGGQV